MSRRPARDDLRRDLATLAGTPVPDLARARVDATEARLRSVHATLAGHSAPRGSHRRAVIGSVGVAAAALATLVAVFLVVDRDPEGRTSLLLTAAEHAFIELPDGRRIEAEVGRIDLPDGSRLFVEAGGTLTVDGITLDPGESATVDDGQIDIDRDGGSGRSDLTQPDGDGPGRSDGADATGGGSRPAGGDDPTTTSRPGDTTATSEPAPSRPVSTTSTPTTSTEPPTTTTVVHDIAPLRAGAEVVDGEVVIRWARYEGTDFRGYLVIATTNGTTPRPGGDGVIVLAVRRDRALTSARAPHEAGMKIRVVVVGPERVVLAASRVLEPVA